MMSRLVLKYESTQQNTFDIRKGLCESTHDSHGSTHGLWVDSYTDESTQQKQHATQQDFVSRLMTVMSRLNMMSRLVMSRESTYGLKSAYNTS